MLTPILNSENTVKCPIFGAQLKPMKNYTLIFLVTFLFMLGISLIPFIELYECRINLNSDLQKIETIRNFSLSYFFGYGYENEFNEVNQTVILTWKGWAFLFILLLGIPLLVTYRFFLKNQLSKND